MKKWFVVLLLACFLGGCQSHSDSHVSPRILRININREPPTMDPRKGSEWVSTTMHFMLFEGLTRLNPDGTVTPAQAKSIDISNDRMTYTFHLRGTYWSDGSMVTAKDFELAWKKVVEPQFGAVNAPLFYPIKNAEKVKKGELPVDQLGVTSQDDLTLVVQLEQPTPYFLDLLAFSTFFPVKHTLDETQPDWMMEASSRFVSNGPLVLKKWKHNQEIVFEKSPQYWEAPCIEFDQVHVSMIADENTAFNMYQNKELDVLGMVLSPIPTDALHRLYEQGKVKSQAASATTFVSFNTNKFPFTNKHIRKALSYAMDRSQIVQNVTQLGEQVATHMIPPNLALRESRSYFKDHDLAKARQELALGLQELGIHTFPTVTLEYSSNDINRKLAQVLQEQWKKTLGIDVEIRQCEHKMLLDKLMNRTYDLATTFWFAQYRDPMSIFERFKFKKNAKNYPDWENHEYIQLLEQSIYDADLEKRAETLARAEALLLDEMPLAPIYHWQTSFMMQDHIELKNFTSRGNLDYARITAKKQ